MELAEIVKVHKRFEDQLRRAEVSRQLAMEGDEFMQSMLEKRLLHIKAIGFCETDNLLDLWNEDRDTLISRAKRIKEMSEMMETFVTALEISVEKLK